MGRVLDRLHAQAGGQTGPIVSGPSAKLRALIFDLDGTLADTIPICIEAFRRAVRRHGGRSLSRGEVESLFGPSEEGMLRRVLSESWEAALSTYLSEYARLHESGPQAFPGLVDALRRLRAGGVELAIVTGKGARSTEISCRALGLEHLFDPIEHGSPAGSIKARSIRRVLDRWSALPRQVAYVGDVPSDIRAAREAGVVAVAAAWSPSADLEALEAQRPDALLRSVGAFVAWAEQAVGSQPGLSAKNRSRAFTNDSG